MTIAPPFAYFGGKQQLAPRIAALLPAHQHYVEPFAGSLALLMAKRPAPMETVNDLDGDLMTFWRVLRKRPQDLARVCALTPHSRAEYLESYDRPADLDEVERARRVWVNLSQGRGGMLRRTGWRHYSDPSGDSGMPAYLDGYVMRMGPAAERLAHVSLECLPALDLIQKYGTSSRTLLYLDPPYLGSTRRRGNVYQHEMRTEDQHRELLAAILDCRAAVVLSGYPSSLYDKHLEAWDRVEFRTGTGQAADPTWAARTEVLWSNREINRNPDLFEAARGGEPS